jgi:hypothetical protein
MKRVLALLLSLAIVAAVAATPAVACVGTATLGSQHGCCGTQTVAAAPSGPCCFLSQPSERTVNRVAHSCRRRSRGRPPAGAFTGVVRSCRARYALARFDVAAWSTSRPDLHPATVTADLTLLSVRTARSPRRECALAVLEGESMRPYVFLLAVLVAAQPSTAQSPEHLHGSTTRIHEGPGLSLKAAIDEALDRTPR